MRQFPVVSFNQKTQRFAVGTVAEHVVVIYDLRTATKWRILEGHTQAITALSFAPLGDKLVSYSAEEAAVRVWQVGAGGFFSGLLGIQGRCIDTTPLAQTPRAGDKTAWLQNCGLTWLSPKEVKLVREDQSVVSLSIPE